jgi:dTMP kinase
MSLKPQPVPGGLLVIFEGLDGVGKSTQLRLAEETLLDKGWPVHHTRALGGTPIGEELRRVILSPAERPAGTDLYISVAIQEALVKATQAERKDGNIILMDRGPLSMAAYELHGEELGEAEGWHYVEAGMKQFNPELTILYDADVNTALARAKKQAGKADYFESKPLSFFERVAEGYQMAAKRYEAAVVSIDAEQPIEAVHEATMAAIQQALAKKL